MRDQRTRPSPPKEDKEGYTIPNAKKNNLCFRCFVLLGEFIKVINEDKYCLTCGIIMEPILKEVKGGNKEDDNNKMQ
ncbi:MAG: hypothetical protein PHD04_05290 [Candidatus Pacebacteria bacterium]|nr:hypothetical protein [Candidatus Paceibacterota bacterium]